MSNNIRNHNVGKSDYSKHNTQPWDVWQTFNLNAWDADITKRVMRTKDGDAPELDYKKVIHICEERIEQEKARAAKEDAVAMSVYREYEHLTDTDKRILSSIFSMRDPVYTVNLYRNIISLCRLRLAEMSATAPLT